MWKSRNNFVFNRKEQNPKLSLEIENQVMEFLCYVASPRSPARNVIIGIRWEKPLAGWKKLNTDGSCVGRTGKAGCGGIIRDENGDWVAGFVRHIGLTNSFVAELWGLRDGLILCCDLNIPCVIVEVDAKVVVDVLKNTSYVNNVVSPLLDDCRQLVARLHQVQINHCYRQVNRCADLLAKMGILSTFIVRLWTFWSLFFFIRMACLLTGYALL